MSPQSRAVHDTQISLERQKRQLDLRYEAAHARAPATPKAPAPARPTLREEAIAGGASSSATPQEPFLAPWRPERGCEWAWPTPSSRRLLPPPLAA